MTAPLVRDDRACLPARARVRGASGPTGSDQYINGQGNKRRVVQLALSAAARWMPSKQTDTS